MLGGRLFGDDEVRRRPSSVKLPATVVTSASRTQAIRESAYAAISGPVSSTSGTLETTTSK